MSLLDTSGGATPLRKNNDQPTGGVRNEVCRLTPARMANHTGSTPALSRIGQNSGSTM